MRTNLTHFSVFWGKDEDDDDDDDEYKDVLLLLFSLYSW